MNDRTEGSLTRADESLTIPPRRHKDRLPSLLYDPYARLSSGFPPREARAVVFISANVRDELAPSLVWNAPEEVGM